MLKYCLISCAFQQKQETLENISMYRNSMEKSNLLPGHRQPQTPLISQNKISLKIGNIFDHLAPLNTANKRMN